MTLVAEAHSIPGTLRQEILIDGQHRLFTDEPPHLGGDGSAPAPHELFPAALAACISTTLQMHALTKGWDLGRVMVNVEYDHLSTPRRFRIAVHLSGDLDDAQLERLEKVARSCPLRRSIDAGFAFVEHLELEPRNRRDDDSQPLAAPLSAPMRPRSVRHPAVARTPVRLSAMVARPPRET